MATLAEQTCGEAIEQKLCEWVREFEFSDERAVSGTDPSDGSKNLELLAQTGKMQHAA